MSKTHKISIDARSALFAEERFSWQGEASNGELLVKVFDALSLKYAFFDEGVYNKSIKRMYPYHLLTINEVLVLPEEIENYYVTADLDIKIKPFISGG
jgi:hypothetical protein